MMSVLIRQADVADFREVESLYREVANKTVGLIRQEDEISYEYVEEFLTLSLKEDVSLVAANESGEIHAYKTNVKAFSHVLSNLTIAVHPEYYSIGVGRAIFNELIALHIIVRRMTCIYKQLSLKMKDLWNIL